MPPVPTNGLIAKTVMDRVAVLMNDSIQSVYTYDAVLPYLNTAIDEMMETLEENNASPTNLTAAIIDLPAGIDKITPVDSPNLPHYPFDLVEIQTVSSRNLGQDNVPFVELQRREFINYVPVTSFLYAWMWMDQEIRFNPGGANTDLEVKLDYVREPLQLAQNENSRIGPIGVRSYLSYKTAALCSMFIGENETRAPVLNNQAELAMGRRLNIDTKGRQEMTVRRRPFRAGYKTRGWV